MKKAICIGFVAVLFLSLLLTVFLPDQSFSEMENRYLAAKPELSLQAVLSGDWMEDMETYLADQFPGRTFFVRTKATLNFLLGQREIGGAYVGADGQLSSIDNLSRCINAGMRYSIPTLGVVAVGKDMERTDRFFKLATRIVAEMGVQLVKTYYCDNFEEVVAACPVPIVVAGGKKLPEDEALTLAYRSIQGGARGLDMGRNIFQSNHPVEMAKAIRMIVHQKATDKEAFEFYTDAIHTK